ncbi:putative glycosyltransferase [Quercus suber]|uniref:Glycosyltransferase n=1 Tax=Quercus suber TaxID=58331 RepID=A0AAW0LEM0_QUESU
MALLYEMSYSWRIEKGLARARRAIKEAARSRSYRSNTEDEFVPRGSIYINPYAFHQRVAHFSQGPMTSIYSTEGQFMDELETKDPNEATAFYIPVSITNIIEFVYKPRIIYTRKPLQKFVKDYVEVISKKHPYWNRSDGADHFMSSMQCHTTEGFDPARDASLPEVKIASENLNPPSFSQPLNNRSILAFFAGREHGFVRKILLRYWKDNDPDIQVHEYLPQN